MKINEIFTENFIMNDDNVDLFVTFSDSTTYPKVVDFINSTNQYQLRLDYFLQHSSDKFVSPLVDKLWNNETYINHNVENLCEYLAKIIYNRFSDKWKKIYDALMTEYNPLENYSMTEERTPDLTFEDTETQKSEITTNRETSAQNKYKGFNTDEPVLLNQTDGTDDVTTSGGSEDNETHKTTTHTGTETLTRSGNIGVTTSQQMLESEFKVRQYDFYKMIYNDIDSILCLSVY